MLHSITQILIFFFRFQLSLAGNHIVDIKGISAASTLRVLDLSDNSIVAIEGTVQLVNILFCFVINRIYNKILDFDWFCARQFVA